MTRGLLDVLGIFDRVVERLAQAGSSWLWTRQMLTPYANLPEKEKASDREQADKIIAMFAMIPAAGKRHEVLGDDRHGSSAR